MEQATVSTMTIFLICLCVFWVVVITAAEIILNIHPWTTPKDSSP